MAAKVGQVIIDFLLNTAKFESDIKKVTKSFKQMGRDLSKTGEALTKNITLPIIAAGAAFVKAANDMDEGMDKIRSATGATGAALKGLGDSMKKVMGEVPQNVKQVSEAIADLNSRLGLTGKPLEEMSTQMLNLARLTGSEVGPLVAAATRLFGDWSVKTEKQADTLDYFYKISQKTGIGIQRLTELTVQYGAPLRSLGFDIETAAAMMGKWEKEGVNMETVLAGLRKGLGTLAKAGVDPAAALKQIETSIKGAKTESEAMTMAIKVFGAKAGPDLARAIMEGRFSVDQLKNSLASSSETINQAAKDTMSFGEKMGLLRNKISLAMAPLGDSLLRAFDKMMPSIERLIDRLAKIADWFTNLSPATQEWVIKLAALAAALGPVLMAFGSMATGISTLLPLITKLVAALGGLATAATLVGSVFAGWKIAQWIDSMDLFGRKAAATTNEIIRQGGSLKDEAMKLGVFNELIAKNKKYLDEGTISAKAYEAIIRDTTDRRKTESMEQYNTRLRNMINEFKAAHPEIAKAASAITNAGAAANTTGFDFDSLGAKTKKLTEDTWALDRAYRNMFLYPDIVKLNEGLEDQTDILLKNAEAIEQQKAANSIPEIDANLPSVAERVGRIREDIESGWGKGIEKAGYAVRSLGDEISTVLTNMSQELAANIVDLKNPLETLVGAAKSVAKGMLAEFIQGFISPFTNIMRKLGNSVGNWFSKILGMGGGGGGGGGWGGIIQNAGGMALGALTSGGVSAGMSAYAASLGLTSSQAAAAVGTGAGAGTAGGISLASLGHGIGAAAHTFAAGLSAFGSALAHGAAFLATNPIGWIIGGGIAAGFGISKLIGKIKGPNSWEAGSKEIARDFGGIQMSDKIFKQWASQYGIKENKAWSLRKNITASPAFLQYAYQVAQQQNKTAAFLGSLSNVGTSWGTFDFLTPFKQGLATGDWSALNTMWAKTSSLGDEGFAKRLGIGSESLFAGQGNAFQAAPVQANSPTVNYQGGSTRLEIHIHGAGDDLVSRIKKDVIPILNRELRVIGNTGFREAVVYANRLTAGAY